MSVVFNIEDFDPCDLAWITASDQTDGSGNYQINWLPLVRGNNSEWVAWSITTSSGNNGTVSIQFSGTNFIRNMGFSDGVIYSPANVPPVPPTMSVVATGNATGVGIFVYLNVLVRSTTRS